ncbi:unnamed protein product [Phaeothamnion confervicola]
MSGLFSDHVRGAHSHALPNRHHVIGMPLAPCSRFFDGGGVLQAAEESRESAKVARRESLRASVAPEPPSGPDATRVRLQMPSGAKIDRRFVRSHPVSGKGTPLRDVPRALHENGGRGGCTFDVRSLSPGILHCLFVRRNS